MDSRILLYLLHGMRWVRREGDFCKSKMGSGCGQTEAIIWQQGGGYFAIHQVLIVKLRLSVRRKGRFYLAEGSEKMYMINRIELLTEYLF